MKRQSINTSSNNAPDSTVHREFDNALHLVQKSGNYLKILLHEKFNSITYFSYGNQSIFYTYKQPLNNFSANHW